MTDALMTASLPKQKPARKKSGAKPHWLVEGGPAPVVLGPGDHPIRLEQIHPSVLDMVARIREAGHSTLIVGGAVRDMMMGRTPKDFDVVTSARPQQVKELFQKARIIGKRFRLVLLRLRGLTVEVSTFRARQEETGKPGLILRDNRYGNPREDAFRRDFTINTLFFDVESFSVIDYTGGLEDLRRQTIRTITPPQVSFTEDPVRMLRAVRFQQRLGFELEPKLEKAIQTLAGQLAPVVRHRLAEETQRFLNGGHAVGCFTEFDRLGLLKPLLYMEAYPAFFPAQVRKNPLPALMPLLEGMDRWNKNHDEPVPPTVALLALLLSLSNPVYRDYLARSPQPVKQRAAVNRELKGKLPVMLSDWGLLKGQVEPALHILNAARVLMYQGPKGKALELRRLFGVREAWVLLAVLERPLGLEGSWLRQGIKLLPVLPVLPILDHPRPRRHGGVLDPRQPAQTLRPQTGEPGPGRPRRRRNRHRRRR